jgi:hypothetical protein
VVEKGFGGKLLEEAEDPPTAPPHAFPFVPGGDVPTVMKLINESNLFSKSHASSTSNKFLESFDKNQCREKPPNLPIENGFG